MPKVTDEKIRFYSTDINLGHEGTNYLSENHEEYKEYPIERKMTKEERMDTLRDLRGTHFKLGNDATNDKYRSMAQDWGSTVKGVAPVTLNEEKLRDLRRTHFSLGNEEDTFESEATRSFKTPTVKGRGDLEEGLLHDLRREHFVLGSDPKMYETTQQAAHHKYIPDAVDEVAKRELLRDLRACHFKLGSEGKNYTTTNFMPAYPGWHPPEHLDLQLRQSHWGLGDEGLSYKTETMDMSNNLPKKGELLDSVTRQRDEVDEHRIGVQHTIYKEPPPVAKVSINVGTDRVNYLSETHEQYKPMPAGYKVARNPKLWNTHWQIGDSQLDYTTEGRQVDHFKNGFEPSEFNEEKAADLRRVHYSLGDEGQNFKTTYGDAFVDKGVTFKPPRDPNLQKTHFALGTEEFKPMTMTQSQFTDTGKRVVDPKEVEQQKAILKDLRSTHFALGNEGTNYTTTGHFDDPYKGTGYKYHKQDPSMKLWGTHFQLGNDDTRKMTTAREQQLFLRRPIESR